MILEALFQNRLKNLFLHEYPVQPASFRDDLLRGLSGDRKSIPFWYLYDERGSLLFERICQQPEYYPTRTELSILRHRAREMAGIAGPRGALVELGSGAGRKVQVLLDAMEDPSAYTAIDISRDALMPATIAIAERNPELEVHAVWADFSSPFGMPFTTDGRTIGFFPGSSIGNFPRADAQRFLADWRKRLGPGSDMIVGVDLAKPVAVLEAAYNDAAGVTAQFSLNLLRRANRELGADFQLRHFRHEARFNPATSAIEIFLVSLPTQVVTLPGAEISLKAGERIHIESSHKYTAEDFGALAVSAGYEPLKMWTDPRQLFSVHYLRAIC